MLKSCDCMRIKSLIGLFVSVCILDCIIYLLVYICFSHSLAAQILKAQFLYTPKLKTGHLNSPGPNYPPPPPTIVHLTSKSRQFHSRPRVFETCSTFHAHRLFFVHCKNHISVVLSNDIDEAYGMQNTFRVQFPWG